MEEDLFPGPAVPLPDAVPRGFAMFRPLSEVPDPVRHATGYAPFAAWAIAEGADPRVLAASLPALLRFLSAHPQVLADAALTRAASIFLGDAVVLEHPRAAWSVLSEPEVGTPAGAVPVLQAVRMLVEHPERHDGFLEILRAWDGLGEARTEPGAAVGRGPAEGITAPSAGS